MCHVVFLSTENTFLWYLHNIFTGCEPFKVIFSKMIIYTMYLQSKVWCESCFWKVDIKRCFFGLVKFIKNCRSYNCFCKSVQNVWAHRHGHYSWTLESKETCLITKHWPDNWSSLLQVWSNIAIFGHGFEKTATFHIAEKLEPKRILVRLNRQRRVCPWWLSMLSYITLIQGNGILNYIWQLRN